MSDQNETPPEETPQPAPQPAPQPPVKPEQTTEDPSPSRTVGGPHDLTDHPALATGTVKNVGDTVIGRDPNEPSFRRPVLQDPQQVQAEQSEGERGTTTAPPAKKASRSKSRGDGADPES